MICSEISLKLHHRLKQWEIWPCLWYKITYPKMIFMNRVNRSIFLTPSLSLLKVTWDNHIKVFHNNCNELFEKVRNRLKNVQENYYPRLSVKSFMKHYLTLCIVM